MPSIDQRVIDRFLSERRLANAKKVDADVRAAELRQRLEAVEAEALLHGGEVDAIDAAMHALGIST